MSLAIHSVGTCMIDTNGLHVCHLTYQASRTCFFINCIVFFRPKKPEVQLLCKRACIYELPLYINKFYLKLIYLFFYVHKYIFSFWWMYMCVSYNLHMMPLLYDSHIKLTPYTYKLFICESYERRIICKSYVNDMWIDSHMCIICG